MTRRNTLQQVCRQTASTTLLAMFLFAICLVPILAAVPTSAAATPASPATALKPAAFNPAASNVAVTPDSAGTAVAAPTQLTVSLTSVKPTVAVPRAPITIIGTVRNPTGVSITAPTARAFIGQRPLTSRQGVSDWAASAREQPAAQQPLTEVARISLGKTLGPGAVAGFRLKIPANAITPPASFAILALSVDVVGTTSAETPRSGGVHTFLPSLATIKAFEPLSIAWLVPLTLDPDPILHGPASPSRTAAWTKAVGPGSRLDRLIRGTQDANVTWAIDPAVLGPLKTPATGPAPAASPTPGATAPVTQLPTQPPGQTPRQATPAPADPVTATTAALAARLRAAAPRHTLWSLPYADPDLAALLALPSGNRVLSGLFSHPSSVDAAVGPARADVAWPVGGTLTPQSQNRLRRIYASPGLAGAVTSASTLSGNDGSTTDASHRSSTGLPLLAYDESLSRTVAQTSSRSTGAITIQRFLADSMALLGERPGTLNRSVLIAEPRTFAGDPTVLRSLFAAVAKEAPWLAPTTTDQLLAASRELPPEVPSPGTTGTAVTATASPTSASTSPAASPAPADPLNPGTSPLTSGKLATTPNMLSAITGIGSILADGQLFAATWTDAQLQKWSTRWRGHPDGLTAIDNATRAAISTVGQGVRVAPSFVNFFTDRGVLQVTVVNNLAVPVHDIYLTLTPAQPRLRIEQPAAPLKIGANSRVNVRVQVTSIAAGLVNVEAVLSTQNGTPLGRNANVSVRVQPPSTWIYWVLGTLTGVVLVLGTKRSLRGSTRASRSHSQELSLNDNAQEPSLDD